MKKVAFRWAEDRDVPDVLRFIRELGFVPRSKETWAGLAMRAALAVRRDEILAAIPLEPRGLVIAPGICVKSANQTVVGVRKELRGRGIGSALQRWLLEESRGHFDVMTVFREDPDSAATRWYRRSGFARVAHIRSLRLDPPYEAQDAEVELFEPASVPRDVLAGARAVRFAGVGGYVPRESRPLAPWLAVHPYAIRYRFVVVVVRHAGYAVLGIGRLHSERERVEVLEVAATDTPEDVLRAAVAVAAREDAEYVRLALADEDPLLSVASAVGFIELWGFDMLAKLVDPGALIARLMGPRAHELALNEFTEEERTQLLLRRSDRGFPGLERVPWIYSGIEYS